MMVANSFDLWRKDVFFSAAEEVQESADIMESAFRLWIREKRKGRAKVDLDELCKELQAALGTAKWQLDEFERAVRMSHGYCRDDTTSTRHKQFVTAIEDQISRVEAALAESFSEEGKQPLRWVNLNEEERDDLAMFLSGTSEVPQSVNSESMKSRPYVTSSIAENSHSRNETDPSSSVSCSRDNPNEIRSRDNNSDCVIDIEDKGTPGSADDRTCQPERTMGARRTWSTPNFSALRIVIPGEEEEERNALVRGIEATPKEKGSKPPFWRQRHPEFHLADGPVNFFNQFFSRLSGFQRQLQGPIHLPFGRSIQLTLVLMLMVFLLLPFVLYST